MRRALAGLLLLVGTSAAAEEVRLVHGNLSLGGELTLAAGKSVADGVVVLTHGTLQHNKTELMQALQQGLAERGLSSLAITLSLGLDDRRGAFDCALPHRHRHSDAVGEIGAWAAWLKSRGAQLVVAAGHSRGGAQTALFAAERGAGLAGVVLIAPSTSGSAELAADYEKSFGRKLAEPLEAARALTDAGRGDAELPPTGFLYCRDARVTAASFLDYYGAEPPKHTPDLLPRIAAPTLVVAAGGDRVVPGLAPALAGARGGSGGLEVVTVADADHFFQDLYAEELVDAVAAFIKGL